MDTSERWNIKYINFYIVGIAAKVHLAYCSK